MEERKCARCGGVISKAKDVRSKYCTDKCRMDAFRESKRKRDSEYKDRVRHGGKRSELLEQKGAICSVCGNAFEPSRIHAHHITHNPQEHDKQDLLCVSCHATHHLLSDNPRKRDITEEEILSAFASSKTLADAARKLSVNRSTIRKWRNQYNIGKQCRNCGKVFSPSDHLKHYCSDECSDVGKKEKWQERVKNYRDTKLKNDRKHYMKKQGITTRNCRACGVEFVPGGKLRFFCENHSKAFLGSKIQQGVVDDFHDS